MGARRSTKVFSRLRGDHRNHEYVIVINRANAYALLRHISGFKPEKGDFERLEDIALNLYRSLNAIDESHKNKTTRLNNENVRFSLRRTM